MRSILQKMCLGVLFAFAFFGVMGNGASAGEQRGTDYSKYNNDAMGLLDAVNRNHGTPARSHSGIGRGPSGQVERHPYQPRKWFRDEAGMIDAINRDYPPVYPR